MGVEAKTEHPMNVFKNGTYYHYEFIVDGRRIRGSTGQTNKQLAIQEERRQRERREKTYQQIVEEEVRTHQRKTVQQAADEFFADYKLKHRSPTYAKYALDHVTELLGDRLIVEVTPKIVKKYQSDRLAANAGAKTINDEVMLLLRLCGDQGDLIRSQLRRAKSLKLKVPRPRAARSGRTRSHACWPKPGSCARRSCSPRWLWT